MTTAADPARDPAAESAGDSIDWKHRPSVPLSPVATRSPLHILDYVMVAVVTFAVYAALIHGPFAPLDDYLMIARNENVFHLTWDNLTRHWTTPSFRIYMPLTLTIWNVLAAAGLHPDPGDPQSMAVTVWPFKLASVLCHALAAAAALRFIVGLVPSRWPAIVGALVWVLHPFQVESVAWTTGLKDELCGLFSFLALGSYLRFAQADPRRVFHSRHWWQTLAFTVLACCSKPTAMTLPVMLLAVDLYVRGRRADLARRIESMGVLVLPAFLIGFVMLWVQDDPAVPRIKPILGPLVAGDTVAFYLVKLLWPHPMLIDYGRHPHYILEHGSIWYAWLLPAVVAAAVLWTRSGLLLLALVLFLVPIGPVSGLKPFDMQQYSTVADHYMYQPMLGVGLVAAFAVQWLARYRRLATVASVAVLGAWAAVTCVQVWRWCDMHRLHAFNFRHNPRSAMVAGNMGFVHLQRGNYVSAKEWSSRALKIDPNASWGMSNLGVIALQQGDLKQAAYYFEKALEGRLSDAKSARQLLTVAARLHDRELAEKAVKRWLQMEPGHPRAVMIYRNIQAAAAAERRAKAATQPAAAPSDAPGPP